MSETTSPGSGSSRNAASTGSLPADGQFQRLSNALPCIIWTCRPDGYVDFLNDKWYERTGQSSEQAIGWGWADAIHPDDREQVVANWQRAIQVGQDYEIEMRYRMESGQYRWHVARALPMRDNDGNVDHWCGISTDIDDKYELMEMSESVTRAIVDNAADGIITIDDHGNIDSINPAGERMLGYRQSEIVGQNVKVLMPDPWHSQHDQYITDYLQTGDKKIIGIGREVEARRKDGSTFPVHLAVSEIRIRGQRKFTGIVRDISERVHAEQSIRESERKLSTLISNLAGVAYRCRIDEGFSVDFVSDGCMQLAGYTPQELLTGASLDLLHPDDRQRIREETEAALAERRHYELTYRICRRNGEYRWVWDRGHGVFSDDGEVLAFEGFMTDITELRRARQKLVQAERLAAIGQMLSAVAHESRNALQRIQSGVDLLALDIDADSDAGQDLQKIAHAREDLQRLFEEIRSYAAPIVLDRSHNHLANVWQRAWTHLEAARIGRDVALQEERNGTDLTCAVDAFRLEQVFRNLFENSLAASRDPVHIEVRCTEVDLNGIPAVCVSYRDDGPGLSDEQKSRMFEPFFTTKSTGTGLGMAISARIVEAHGGVMRVGECLQGGAEFLITLPRSSEPDI